MAEAAAHLRQATRNHDLIDKLDAGAISNDHPDWIVTVCFYTVVHLVEAIFGVAKNVKFGEPGQSITVEGPVHSDAPPPVCPISRGQTGTSPHRIRGTWIRWNPMLIPGSCGKAYKNLLEMSYTSRYNCQDVAPSEANAARRDMGVAWDMLNSRYATITAPPSTPAPTSTLIP